MNLTLHLTTELEAKLREVSEQSSKDPESLAIEALQDKLDVSGQNGSQVADDMATWLSQLTECVDLHPVAAHFVDDSREAIYSDRGQCGC